MSSKIHIDINEDSDEAIFLCGGGNPENDSSVYIPKSKFDSFMPYQVNCRRCLQLYHEALAKMHRKAA